MIAHITLPDGKSQTLGFIGSDREGRIVCVVEAGQHKLGKIQYDEKIIVMAGEIFIDGKKMMVKEEKILGKGTELVIATEKIACFIRKTIGYRE